MITKCYPSKTWINSLRQYAQIMDLCRDPDWTVLNVVLIQMIGDLWEIEANNANLQIDFDNE